MTRLILAALAAVLCVVSGCKKEPAAGAPAAGDKEVAVNAPGVAVKGAGGAVTVGADGVAVKAADGTRVAADKGGVQIDGVQAALARAASAASDDSAARGKVLDCVAGKCKQICPPKARCTASCAGGDCVQVCGAGGTCVLDCAGGDCKQTCPAGATCTMTCTGGDCQRSCHGTSRCRKTCTGGDCTG